MKTIASLYALNASRLQTNNVKYLLRLFASIVHGVNRGFMALHCGCLLRAGQLIAGNRNIYRNLIEATDISGDSAKVLPRSFFGSPVSL